MLILQLNIFQKPANTYLQQYSIQFYLLPQNISQALFELSQSNYASRLEPILNSLEKLDDASKISLFQALRTFNSANKSKLSVLQRQFIYEIACALAPTWVAQEVKKDYETTKTEEGKNKFRKENGYEIKKGRAVSYKLYDYEYNNCRHYAMRKYYQALNEFIPEGTKNKIGPDVFRVGKKTFYGRPKDFDYKINKTVKCFNSKEWDKMVKEDKELYYKADDGVAFVVVYSGPANSKQLKNILRPGDLVTVNQGAHSTNPHVGVYDGEENIVNIHTPLSSDPIKRYTRNATQVIVRRLAVRKSEMAEKQVIEEQDPWTLPIKKIK